MVVRTGSNLGHLAWFPAVVTVLNNPTRSVESSQSHNGLTAQLSTRLLMELCGGEDFFDNWFAGFAAVQERHNATLLVMVFKTLTNCGKALDLCERTVPT